MSETSRWFLHMRLTSIHIYEYLTVVVIVSVKALFKRWFVRLLRCSCFGGFLLAQQTLLSTYWSLKSYTHLTHLSPIFLCSEFSNHIDIRWYHFRHSTFLGGCRCHFLCAFLDHRFLGRWNSLRFGLLVGYRLLAYKRRTPTTLYGTLRRTRRPKDII